MYGREEAAKLRQQFWITYGKYMKPIRSAEGLPVNWVNYKTGVKHIFFKMNADQKKAAIAIEITHGDSDQRQFYFEKFESVKTLLEATSNDNWDWEPFTTNEFGIPLARISKTLNGVNIYDQSQWPNLISFLKPNMISLDEFWTDVKPLFES